MRKGLVTITVTINYSRSTNQIAVFKMMYRNYVASWYNVLAEIHPIGKL